MTRNDNVEIRKNKKESRNETQTAGERRRKRLLTKSVDIGQTIAVKISQATNCLWTKVGRPDVIIIQIEDIPKRTDGFYGSHGF